MRKILPVLLALALAAHASAAKPTCLQGVAHDNPLAAQRPAPLLSWRMDDTKPGAKQAAYQVLVSSSPEKLAANQGDLWDTGEVASDQSLFVAYAGRPLASLQDAFWKVRLRNGAGEWSDWSENSTWRMGLLKPSDWEGASWIGLDKDSRSGPLTTRSYQPGEPGKKSKQPQPESPPAPKLRGTQAAPLLRKQVEIAKSIRRATAYVCGLGYFELSVNGQRVGDRVLDPAQTSYDKRAFYVPLDLTSKLKPGKNVLGIMLGNGFYGQDFALSQGLIYGEPKVKALVKIEYADGSKQSIFTGTDWKATTGPILFDNIYIGETYDARLEIPGWDSPSFDDSKWAPAKAAQAPTENLVSQNIPPIRKIREVKPVALLPGKNGAWIIDLGQNIGGWLQIRVQEKAGNEIRMRFAEHLMPSGDAIDTLSTGIPVTHADQQDIYVCRGGGPEQWEPRFTSHGFRYAEIEGLSGKPDLKNFTGWLVRTDLPLIGSFASSNPRLEKFYGVSLWTLEDNIQGVLSDCPHRERCGWMGDLHACGEFASFAFDMRDFLSRVMDDIRTVRGLGGRQPSNDLPKDDPRAPGNISVGKRLCGSARPDWGMAVVLVPWFSYLHYGDLAVVRDNWDMMTEWIAYLEEFAVKDGIVIDGYGDWCPPGSNSKMEASPQLTSTALFYQALCHMEFLAKTIGKPDQAAAYGKRAEEIKAAFLAKFGKPDGGFGSQTATAVALWSGLVPKDQQEPAVASLEKSIMVDHQGHYSTGIFGHRPLYTVLNDNGRSAVTQHLWEIDDWPSLAFMTEKHGMTTWPETPLDWPAGERYAKNSYNHPMQAGFAAVFFESLAGIRPDPEHPGFKNIILEPTFLEGTNKAGATLDSPYGVIRSAWERNGDKVLWNVTVPPNATAEVRLPSAIKGMPEKDQPGVQFLREIEGRRIYALASGSHAFSLNP